MSDDRTRSGAEGANTPEPTLHLKDFEIAKAIRSEMLGYLTKAAFVSATVILGTLSAVIWAYVEWRLPQIAGGVPRGAVMAFAEESCPEGWVNFQRGQMRVIVGALPNAENADNTSPRRLYYGEQRGEYAEYLLTKAPPRESATVAENERPVMMPGVLALTYCEKMHER